jgi:hypothetical protein
MLIDRLTRSGAPAAKAKIAQQQNRKDISDFIAAALLKQN